MSETATTEEADTTTDATVVDETPELEPVPTFDEPPAKKPEVFVAGSTFYVNMPTLEFSVLLKLSVRDLRKLRDSVSDEDDELDQLVMLLELVGDEKTLDVLLDADAFDAMFAATKYFQAWEERSKVRLGK